MKQGDKIIFTAESYADAETVGAVDGITVFVPQLLVGEKALVNVTYVKRNVAYGSVVNVLEASLDRKQAECRYFGDCGGCTLMYMDYRCQLEFKRHKVQSNLRKIGGISAQVLPCVPSDLPLRYRNKLSLPVRGKVGNVKIGMYRKGTHNVVDISECLLSDSWCNTLVEVFRQFADSHGIAPYNEKNFSGDVRHLVARYVDEQLLVTVVTNGRENVDFAPFCRLLKEKFPKFGLFVNENSLKNNVILGDKTTHIYGIKHIDGEHLGVKFQLRPDSFFQVNDNVKNKIYRKVQQLLDVSDTEVLVDCFSGIGILTNVLASNKYVTYAVEIEPSAVADANAVCKQNNAPNVTNICGDVRVELPKITKKHLGKVMTLVVDPPRKGLGEAVCQTIQDAMFDNIVYISCDSATLARDLKMLNDYVVDYVEPYDMFPNTAEVETVVHLKRI